MIELKDMTREELLAVIDIKSYRINELEEEVEVLKELVKSLQPDKYVQRWSRDGCNESPCGNKISEQYM